MKHTRLLGVLSLAVLAMALSPENAEAAASSYKMFCKGPFKLEALRLEMVIRFAKAPNGTTNGASLQNGQCAWTDRPLNSAEPSNLHFGPKMGKSVYPTVIACAREPGCVMGLYASKSTGNTLWADRYKTVWLLP